MTDTIEAIKANLWPVIGGAKLPPEMLGEISAAIERGLAEDVPDVDDDAEFDVVVAESAEMHRRGNLVRGITDDNLIDRRAVVQMLEDEANLCIQTANAVMLKTYAARVRGMPSAKPEAAA